MASVSYVNVSKCFGQMLAVNNLNIEIADKEFMVFVGPSGCGKTTSLRMLAGLEVVDGGEILIDGVCVNELPPKDRDIAMVFQNYALYPHMNVYDNLSFGLRLRREPRLTIDARVRDAAAALGIDRFLRRKPKQLSGGERQRVALGRAIVRHPKVFLMDEPLSNLDAKLRVQTRAEIIKLHERLEGTFVYVTHDQVEAMTMGTRIAVMNKGVLQQVDTPQRLYDEPNNMFVAGFIGSPSMNFFRGTLTASDDEMAIETRSFRLAMPPCSMKVLKPHLGSDVVLGIRPEDIHICSHVPKGVTGMRIQARLDVKELMGNEAYLHFVNNGEPFIARVPPRATVTTGEISDLLIDVNKVHLFDLKTERAIVHGNSFISSTEQKFSGSSSCSLTNSCC